MGKILGAVGTIIGLGKSPKASAAPIQDIKDDQTKTKSGRAALYETSGGITGQELNPDQVKKRDTLFGN